MTIVLLLYLVAALLLIGASALIFRELLEAVGADEPSQRAPRRTSSRLGDASSLRRAA
jgi:hypothetical protein